MLLIGMLALEDSVGVNAEHVQLGVVLDLVASQTWPLQQLEGGGLLPILHPVERNSQRLIIGLCRLHVAKGAPLVQVSLGNQH